LHIIEGIATDGIEKLGDVNLVRYREELEVLISQSVCLLAIDARGAYRLQKAFLNGSYSEYMSNLRYLSHQLFRIETMKTIASNCDALDDRCINNKESAMEQELEEIAIRSNLAIRNLSDAWIVISATP